MLIDLLGYAGACEQFEKIKRKKKNFDVGFMIMHWHGSVYAAPHFHLNTQTKAILFHLPRAAREIMGWEVFISSIDSTTSYNSTSYNMAPVTFFFFFHF